MSDEGHLKVESLAQRLHPVMSEAARACLASRHSGVLDDMVTIARTYEGPPTDEDVRQLGLDLSAMVEQLAQLPERFPFIKAGWWKVPHPVDGLLGVPMSIPMASGQVVALMYVRIRGTFHLEVRAHVRKLLLEGCRLHALDLRGGELPPDVRPGPEVDVASALAELTGPQ